MERIEGLVARGQDINRAWLASYAFADGKLLKQEWDGYQAELKLAPGETASELTDADEQTVVYIISRWPNMPTQVS